MLLTTMGARELHLVRAAWQSKSKSSDTIPGGIGTTAIYTTARRFCWGTPFFDQRARESLSARTRRATEREKQAQRWLSASKRNARTSRHRVSSYARRPVYIRLLSAARLGGFRPEKGQRNPGRDFFRKMNFLPPFCRSRPLRIMKARLL